MAEKEGKENSFDKQRYDVNAPSKIKAKNRCLMYDGEVNVDNLDKQLEQRYPYFNIHYRYSDIEGGVFCTICASNW